jgi:hypothetical protein
MPLERGDAFADGDELGGHDHDRRLVECFDDDGVVDTPRRARASITKAHHRAVDEPSPVVEGIAGALAFGPDALADDQSFDRGTVAHQQGFPSVEDDEIRPPGSVEAEADGHPFE